MDRRKTIIATVMINAGLLTALFIAAIAMQDEPSKTAPDLSANFKQSAAESKLTQTVPLYGEIVNMPSVAESVPQAAKPPVSSMFLLPPAADGESTLVQSPLPPPSASTIASPARPEPILPAPLSSASLPQNSEIVVQKGESLEKIAKKHHTTVDEIIKLNQLPSSFLKAGQRLKIPVEKAYETMQPKAPISLTSDQAEYYTMKVGDNPWSIAMKHHMKVDELLKLNGLNEKTARKLKPGDRLRIK